PKQHALSLHDALPSFRQRKEVHLVTAEKEAELARTTRLRGFRYGLHDFLAALDLNALKAVNDHVEADYVNESLLDRRTKELLIIDRKSTRLNSSHQII